MALTTLCVACNKLQDNPLVGQFDTPYQTPPFDKIELRHYEPAFDWAIDLARGRVDAIVRNSEAPTFENTIVALERSDMELSSIAGIFFNLNESETSDQMQEIALKVQPKLVDYQNDITLNADLFARVKAVYDSREQLNLSMQDAKLLDNAYKSFTRNGANLSDADKEKYREITAKESELTLKYGQNVLAETNAFTLNFSPDEADRIAELPDFVKEGMAAEAKAHSQQGWTVTLQAPSMIPFLTYSSDREAKQQVWMAYNTRGMKDGANDNRDVCRQIALLRLQEAQLLGYNTYADYVLEERMAKDVPTVESFLNQLLDATHSYAQKDYADVVAYARATGVYGDDFEFMPWDWAYFNEKYKMEKYNLNEEDVKPYLQLDNVRKGVFMLAERLYGLTFKENNEIPKYHPDVQTFEVYSPDGKFLAVLYLDFFPRESKRGGAWMTAFREEYVDENGTEVRPLISLNCNFTKPTETSPSLLTFDELTTFLHEFGHCLHGIFAEGQYASLTGTNVYRDFVELPSQIMENWATETEFLDLWATHYQSGEPIPQVLVDKIVAAKNYLAAYANVRQLSFGLIDMAWHSITAPVEQEVGEFEHQAVGEAQILPYIPGTAMSTAFTHIFSGGYAAGYYSYKWAEVLEADAFSLFKEKGIFNRDVAESFRSNILSAGGVEHPMELYVRFRGHEPSVQALIDKMELGEVQR